MPHSNASSASRPRAGPVRTPRSVCRTKIRGTGPHRTASVTYMIDMDQSLSQKIIQEAFHELKQAALRRCGSQEEYDSVLHAFEFANDAYKDLTDAEGEPLILHPLALAQIVVSEIGLGFKSIITALLHDLAENTEYSVEDIQSLFGQKIAGMVQGLMRINQIFAADIRYSMEGFKKMLLSLNDDVRIIIIKLAHVLLVLRKIDKIPENKRVKLLSEAMYVFVPLAHRLGLYKIKSEMENIWMQYSMPEEYHAIQARLKEKMSQREEAVNLLFIDPIVQKLRLAGYHFNIYKRIKQPYSIWHKMQKRQVGFEEIYDIFAVRIVFYPKTKISEKTQCEHIESIISSLFQSNPERRRDWITAPKETGYEALHATYLSPKGNWIEVQIRSKRMDDIAERGLAAHWKYKDENQGPKESEMDRWIALVRSTLENRDIDALDFFDKFHTGSLSTEIYVFTPRGEPRILPKGATALDFAYYVHSNIGSKAIAAKINGKLLPLSTPLKSGDQAEIITAESQEPKLEWLDFLKTSKARNLLGDALNVNMKRYIPVGQELLQKRLQAMGIQPQARVLRKMIEAYGVNNRDELYSKIGIGFINLDSMESILKKNTIVKMVKYWYIAFQDPEIPEENKKNYKMAPCCRPIPGEKITGIYDSDKVLYIHSVKCPHARPGKNPGEGGLPPVAVEWKKYVVQSNLVHLYFSGRQRTGVMYDIDLILSQNFKINTRQFHINTHDGIFEGYIDLYTQNSFELDNLIKRLYTVKGMQTVKKEKKRSEKEDNQ